MKTNWQLHQTQGHGLPLANSVSGSL